MTPREIALEAALRQAVEALEVARPDRFGSPLTESPKARKKLADAIFIARKLLNPEGTP